MKTKGFYLKMLLLAVPMLSLLGACSNNDEEDKNKLIIDPYAYSYVFNANGECSVRPLWGMSKADFLQKIAGKGWKWVCTYKVNPKTSLLEKEDFYSNIFGLSPMHYYFDDEKCTKFYFSDVKGKPCHHTSPYNYSETDYWLSIAGNKEFQIIQPPKDGYLYVLQILGISNNGSITYGQSVYKQMTDEELKDMREQYNTEVIH